MLIIENVSHRYASQVAVADISFRAEPGTLTCLVGPSGCGKTTLLRLIAGLMPLQSGRIALNDQALATPDHSLPPEKRAVGLVFQEGALFPHMTVAENIGFGLAASERNSRVDELLSEVGLQDFAKRHPDTLSGGQRQRVALARAIAPRPSAVLFDEPYANLDMQLRRKLRDDAKSMIRETGAIGVVVTHDPEEVLAIADHVIVLKEGKVLQQGTARSVYERPNCLDVAQLFGHAQTLTGHISNNTVETAFGQWPRACLQDAHAPAGEATLAVRPHDLALADGDDATIAEIRIADGANEFVLVSDNTNTRLLVTEPLGAIKPALSWQAGQRIAVTPRTASVLS